MLDFSSEGKVKLITSQMAVSRSFKSLFSKKFSSSLICKINASLYFSTSIEKEQPLTVHEFLNKHHFSQHVASRVASGITNLKNPQSSDSLLSFLKENEFSITQLEIIMKTRPTFLNASLEKTIKPKITLLQDMGFSANEIASIITKNPNFLGTSIKDRILPSLSLLTGILGSKLEMARVLRHSVRLFSVDLEKNLIPNIEFMKSCGIAMEEILKIIHLFPGFFLTKPENMRKYVYKADELGVDRSSKMFLYAVRVVSSMSNENLELKLKAFRDFGFSEEDILRVFRSAPIVITISSNKIRKIKQILLQTEKYDFSSVVKHPTILTCSVESRYKPRLQVLEILEKNNLIEKWPTLATLVVITNKKFCEKFVDPFSNELPDLKLLIAPRSR